MEWVDVIKELGVTVAMLVYFIYRDLKYMNKLDSTLEVIIKFLEKMGVNDGDKDA